MNVLDLPNFNKKFLTMCNLKSYLPDLEIGVTDFEGAGDLSNDPSALFTESITQ